MMLKKLNKKEILQFVEEQFNSEFVEKFKKYKLDDLRQEFKLTHIDVNTGKIFYAQPGVYCLGCADMLRNDYRSPLNSNYCGDC
jgi:hypothetical protein